MFATFEHFTLFLSLNNVKEIYNRTGKSSEFFLENLNCRKNLGKFAYFAIFAFKMNLNFKLKFYCLTLLIDTIPIDI